MTRFLTVLLVLATSGFGQGRVVRIGDAKAVNSVDRARFDSAVANATPAPTASHFAMVRTAGTVGDDVATGIMAIVHTTIPHGSIVGLRIRRFDGTTQVEGVSQWDQDLTPGQGLVVKNPGGALLFSSTKQYELMVMDPATLVTTTDYIPIISGGGAFISGSPVLSFSAFSGDAFMRIPMTQGGSSQVDAVVVNGTVVPQKYVVTDQGGVSINLTQFAVCFWGDVSVTVVRGGQSDTTQFRFPQGMTQSCGGSRPKG